MNNYFFRQLAQLVFTGIFAAVFIFNSSAQTVTGIVPDGKAHQFEARDHQFFIDGQPTMLVAGEMHFGRVAASVLIGDKLIPWVREQFLPRFEPFF